MTHYRTVGVVPRKRHTVHYADDGRRYAEELIGQEGFSGASSLLYHRNSPSALLHAEVVEECVVLSDNLPVVPMHLRTDALTADGRHVLLGNDDVVIAWQQLRDPTPLLRDAVGDELAYIHRGTATLESVFGGLAVGDGDYVLVPAGVTHRWVPGVDGVELLRLEARGHIGPPRRYLSDNGQFLESAPYCERDLRAPTELLVSDEPGETEVLVRTRGGISRHHYAHHPFDVVGWDGCVYPWAFSIHDFEPIVGRIHQPPHVHQTFEGPGFVVCSFVPRPYDFHPDAVKVPYHHANTDSDEVLFYASGEFMSRGSGIGPGSLTLHPSGFIHGPQPGSFERARSADRTEEVAVMVDTFRPLRVSAAARDVADGTYERSWVE